MSIYIKGVDMPKDGKEIHLRIDSHGEVYVYNTYPTMIGKAVEVPTPHGVLKDAEKLYEQTAEWEAQALHMCDVSARDEEDKQEWRRWSTILTERSAFKHDVFDAPVVIEAEE